MQNLCKIYVKSKANRPALFEGLAGFGSFISHQMDSKAADLVCQIDGVQGAVGLVFRGVLVELEAASFQISHSGSHVRGADGDMAVFAQIGGLHQLHSLPGEDRAIALLGGQAEQSLEHGSALSCLLGVFTIDAHMGQGVLNHN